MSGDPSSVPGRNPISLRAEKCVHCKNCSPEFRAEAIHLAPNGSQPQQQAMTWVRDNAPRNAVIITSSYMYTDLLDPQGMAVGGGTPFTKAQMYTNAALDPAIAQKQL